MKVQEGKLYQRDRLTTYMKTQEIKNFIPTKLKEGKCACMCATQGNKQTKKQHHHNQNTD